MSAWSAMGTAARGERLEKMKASPNWNDGKFVNTLKVIEPKLVKATVEWLKGTQNTVPDAPLPVIERTAADYERAPDSGLRITWLGHSTLLIEIDGRRVLVDPVFSERSSPVSWAGPKRFHAPPLPLDELPELDAVVISHDHYDHLDYRTIQALGERAPLYLVPLGVGAHLEYWGVPPERIVERDWWGEFTHRDLTFTCTPARHFSGRSPVMADKNKKLWSGWAIAGPAHRVYYSGDTGMFAGFTDIGARLGPFDAVFIEVGAYNRLWADIHIGPEQAIAARVMLGSGLFLPVHWGTFDLAMHAWTEPVERLLLAAQQAGVKLAIPKSGQRIEPANPPKIERWWPELPWQSAADAPLVSSGL